MQIDLWYTFVSSNQPGYLESWCEQWLNPDELIRANRFRIPAARNQFVVGRGMSRYLISRRVSLTPQKIVFQISGFGKPTLANPDIPDVPFNVAHTDGMVVCGLCDQGFIGVDVERMNRRTNSAIADRYFSPSESAWVAAQPAAEQPRAFLRVWTLKESFIKAIGTGLTTPLDRFAFEKIETENPSVRVFDPSLSPVESWSFYTPNIASEFLVAIAVGEKADRQETVQHQLTTHPFTPPDERDRVTRS